MTEPQQLSNSAATSAEIEGLSRASDIASFHALSVIEAAAGFARLPFVMAKANELGAVVVDIHIVNPNNDGLTPFKFLLFHPLDRGRGQAVMSFDRLGVTIEDLVNMPGRLLAEVTAEMTYEVMINGPGLLIDCRETYEWAVRSHLDRLSRQPKPMVENFVDDSLGGPPNS